MYVISDRRRIWKIQIELLLIKVNWQQLAFKYFLMFPFFKIKENAQLVKTVDVHDLDKLLYLEMDMITSNKGL